MAEEYGFPLRQLTVEITESALVKNMERARAIANKLRQMGCELALDDVGTGHSSLRQIRALPFSKLKVDRSFVQSMPSERESRKIVAALVGLGYSLDMVTVAEDVETEEQADLLLQLGCELAQGSFYGGPLPAERIPDMLAASPRLPATRSSGRWSSVAVAGLDALPTQRLAQLQAIYDGAPVGLCFLDRNFRYISLNQRLADINGASVMEHLGRTVSEMLPGYFPIVEPYLRRALKGEGIPKIEAPRPGQPERNVLLSYQPVFDESREVIGVSIAVVSGGCDGV